MRSFLLVLFASFEAKMVDENKNSVVKDVFLLENKIMGRRKTEIKDEFA